MLTRPNQIEHTNYRLDSFLPGAPFIRAFMRMSGLRSAEEPGPERAFFARTDGNPGVNPQAKS